MAVLMVLGDLYCIWSLLLLVWLYIDVRYFEVEWYCIPLCLTGYGHPIVMLTHWIRTR